MKPGSKKIVFIIVLFINWKQTKQLKCAFISRKEPTHFIHYHYNLTIEIIFHIGIHEFEGKKFIARYRLALQKILISWRTSCDVSSFFKSKSSDALSCNACPSKTHYKFLISVRIMKFVVLLMKKKSSLQCVFFSCMIYNMLSRYFRMRLLLLNKHLVPCTH